MEVTPSQITTVLTRCIGVNRGSLIPEGQSYISPVPDIVRVPFSSRVQVRLSPQTSDVSAEESPE